MKIITKKRKTNFLSPSGLKCLANLPTVNVSAGCVHGCVYCYTKGYSIYPGDGSIEIYEEMAERIADEIKRKRRKPRAVYFCPSCDPFQAVGQVQQITFDVMKVILENGIGVQFVTKGRISDGNFELFKINHSKVAGQIGITSTDDEILGVLEPGAASVEERLSQLQRLIDIGVTMSARCDPLIYGVTDGDRQLRDLFLSIADTRCREVAVSYLFLRPAVVSSLKKNIGDCELLKTILTPFSEGVNLPIGLKNSVGKFLPRELRESSFKRIGKIANDCGLTMHICGCKNSDITNESCYIVREQEAGQKQLLFE